MPGEERKRHPHFSEYMKMIVEHPNYRGLPIETKSDGTYKWVTTAKSRIGKERIEWCKKKAQKLGIPVQPGVYADVMLAVHPTKRKVCQTCGKEMSLYYHYPNAIFLKSLNGTFGTDFTDCDHIGDIWDRLIANGTDKADIARFLIKKGGLRLDPSSAGKDEIIDALEYACRKGSRKCLGPGAMSDFPDRYDGFHSYNRYFRAAEDKGRSRQNLKCYTKDRRAYEYWSDGNIHAANRFMGSGFFDGASADHIGPVSLGFVHDPAYLRKMPTNDNSAKRDRLQYKDIEEIIKTQNRAGVYPMSWHSRLIWEYIRANYKENPKKIAGPYRNALKQNMANFMFILLTVLNSCPVNGEEFLTRAFLEPNYACFRYSYSFNEFGEIISAEPRHLTDRNRNETDRYRRVAIASVYDYNAKNNRRLAQNLSDARLWELSEICADIERHGYSEPLKNRLVGLVESIEKDAVENMPS